MPYGHRWFPPGAVPPLNRSSRLTGCAVGFVGLLLVIVVTAFVGYRARHAWLPYLADALDVSTPPGSADVIIILGGGDGDREDYGALLYRQGRASHVIATGAPVGSDSETNELVQRGIPRQAIVLASGTQNTHEDAERSRQLMLQHRWRTALLVTDRYHIRRSLWTFQTAFIGTPLTITPTPVVGGWFDASRWWQTEGGFVAVNDEYLKLVYYFARGYIAPSVVFQS